MGNYREKKVFLIPNLQQYDYEKFWKVQQMKNAASVTEHEDVREWENLQFAVCVFDNYC